jgi:hypothetical protein
MPSERRWMPNGHLNQVAGGVDKTPLYDPRSGAHLWIVAVSFRVDPTKFADATATPMLDSENLLLITDPGCYYCEEIYTPLLATRRCKGAPRG